MNREQLTNIVENKSTVDTNFYKGFVAMGNLLLEDDDLIILSKTDFKEDALLDFSPDVRDFLSDIITRTVQSLDEDKIKYLAVDRFTDMVAGSLLKEMGMNDD